MATGRRGAAGGPGRPAFMALAAAAMTLLCPLRAQIYTFDKVPAPEPKTLHPMQIFYIYSHQDAPDRSAGRPFVKFHSLQAHSTAPGVTDEDLMSYDSLQLSMLPFRDYWKRFDNKKLCSTEEDVAQGLAQEANTLFVNKTAGVSDNDINLYTHTVRFQTAVKDQMLPMHASAVYILVYSNCGDVTQATVSGSVVVKNPYGFLPGNEFHKMPFYGWLSVIYTTMALVWMGLSIRWWRELFHIQYCIALVILLGLVEAFFWWVFFNNWNNTGLRNSMLFVISIMATVIKSAFSYMLVLVASLGWGVTRPYLDHRTIMKVQGLAFLYIVMEFIRETVLSFRYSHSLSWTFVLLCLLPVALLNGAIFYWIFSALSDLIETLRERRQHEKLLLFERLWKILIFALGLASLTMLFQIFDLSRDLNIRWHYQWFFAEGVSHLLFLVVLAAMMYLWAPHTNSQRYAYSHQVSPDDKDDKKVDVWAEEEVIEDDGDDESFWATTHGKHDGATSTMPADRIGASVS